MGQWFSNIMPTSRCLSTSLTTFLSLHLYLSMFDTTKITLLYTTDPNNSSFYGSSIPTPSNHPTNQPALETWHGRSAAATTQSPAKKLIKQEIFMIWESDVCEISRNSIIPGWNQLTKCSRFSRHIAVFLTPQKSANPPPEAPPRWYDWSTTATPQPLEPAHDACRWTTRAPSPQKKPPVGHGKLGVGGATPIGTLREILESWSIFVDSVWCLLMSIINELVRERKSWVFRKPKVTFLDSFGIEFMWQTMAQSTVASPNFDRSRPPVVAGFHKNIWPFAALQTPIKAMAFPYISQKWAIDNPYNKWK